MQNELASVRNERKLNIGILGCANVARKYAINAFKNLKEVGKIFIASRDVSKAKKWSEEFNIGFKNSYEEIVRGEEIDVIYIPLPTALHEEWAIKCAENGKHVICEKTLSFNLDSTRKMVEEFRKRDLFLFENFVCDYHPQHTKILSLIKSGEIGNPLFFGSHFGFEVSEGDIRLNKSMENGCFNDMGTYMVLMSRRIFQEEPISVVADFTQSQGIIYMEFSNEKSAVGSFGFNRAYQNNYSVWGSKGRVETKRAYSIPPTMKAIVSLLKVKPEGDINEQIEVDAVNQFELAFSDFCKAIIEKNEGKRLERYTAILSQAKVMEALRNSNAFDKKVFLG